MLTITFVTNYLNHYQRALCDQFYKILGNNFFLITTEPLAADRILLGWDNCECQYEIKAYESSLMMANAMEKCNSSEVVIIGSAPELFIAARLKENKLTFRYSERLFKESYAKIFVPSIAYKYYNKYIKYRNSEMYILAASAFAAKDYSLLGCFRNKCFKWGYFPEMKEINEHQLSFSKDNLVTEIVWVGRLIGWKQADLLVDAAYILKNKGLDFGIKIVGIGEKETALKNQVTKLGLDDKIKFTGGISPSEVYHIMEKSNIFVFTSNFREGWGVVLNEAMGLGCVPIASDAAGSTPWLVNNRENGYIFSHNSYNELAKCLETLILDRELQCEMGRKARSTIEKIWNPKIAAERFIQVSTNLKKGNKIFFNEGPCSQAEEIPNKWKYK